MKIGVFSDIHGNLPALEVILEKFKEQKCDCIYCLGDVIAIGPYPRECIEMLIKVPNVKFLMGNHEEYFLKGIKNIDELSISEGERRHQYWVERSLNNEIKEAIRKFPYSIEEAIEGVTVSFTHYALNCNKDSLNTFKPIEKDITEESVDMLFEEINSDVIFFGHEHRESSLKGKKHYVNVGSSGCTKEDVTHCTIVEFKDKKYDIKVHRIKYDKDKLFKAFKDREVPEREFLEKVFFGYDGF